MGKRKLGKTKTWENENLGKRKLGKTAKKNKIKNKSRKIRNRKIKKMIGGKQLDNDDFTITESEIISSLTIPLKEYTVTFDELLAITKSYRFSDPYVVEGDYGYYKETHHKQQTREEKYNKKVTFLKKFNKKYILLYFYGMAFLHIEKKLSEKILKLPHDLAENLKRIKEGIDKGKTLSSNDNYLLRTQQIKGIVDIQLIREIAHQICIANCSKLNKTDKNSLTIDTCLSIVDYENHVDLFFQVLLPINNGININLTQVKNNDYNTLVERFINEVGNFTNSNEFTTVNRFIDSINENEVNYSIIDFLKDQTIDNKVGLNDDNVFIDPHNNPTYRERDVFHTLCKDTLQILEKNWEKPYLCDCSLKIEGEPKFNIIQGKALLNIGSINNARIEEIKKETELNANNETREAELIDISENNELDSEYTKKNKISGQASPQEKQEEEQKAPSKNNNFFAFLNP